ncbi:thermonuclease family protein [Synechococcus sp. 1G10]|uniref:thermonuclease family protein n=1 Tax=Synechococcus sp. 1G10 TaxID=2025605 RepID=UPI000B9917A8|nr:thermonuclease family protein [Synechococcus sp. 1G10]
MASCWLTLLLALVAALPSAGSAQTGQAEVLSIGDGDTIRVQQGQQRITVRLACIDAPEMAQAPHGAKARSYLQSRLRLGSSVTLRTQTVDRYGRTVAEVFSGVNINLALVEDGMAFAYRKYLGQCDAKEYLDAEFRASRSRYGVWQVPGGITRPWDFRRSRSEGRSARTTESIPGGRKYRCKEIGSYQQAQVLLRQGHTYLDSNGDGEACESLR